MNWNNPGAAPLLRRLLSGVWGRRSAPPGTGSAGLACVAHGRTAARANGASEDAAAWSEQGPTRGVVWGAVADGLGGRSGGGAAARLAIQTAVAYLGGLGYRPAREELVALGRVCDTRIQGEAEAGLTTLCVAVVAGGRARVLRSGDSRIYLFRADAKQSRLVQLLPNTPRHPMVGSGHARLAVESVTLKPRELLLLCTDALIDLLSEEALATELAAGRDSGDPASTLLQTARRRAPAGFPDDLSAVILAVVDPEGPPAPDSEPSAAAAPPD